MKCLYRKYLPPDKGNEAFSEMLEDVSLATSVITKDFNFQLPQIIWNIQALNDEKGRDCVNFNIGSVFIFLCVRENW